MSRPRILILNDDGINAPGIALMESLARELSDDIWVVAPSADRSGAARSVTLALPVRLERVDDRHFAVTGTPTDCLVLALNTLLDPAPDLVLSGVNRGPNLGEDVGYSGTCAVAMEAAMGGIAAISLSIDFAVGDPVHWDTPRTHALPIIERLLEIGGDDVFWNVNFPALPPSEIRGVRVTTQGARTVRPFQIHHRVDPSERDYYWLKYQRNEGTAEPDSDLRAVAEGYISLTPVPLRPLAAAQVAVARDALDGSVLAGAVLDGRGQA